MELLKPRKDRYNPDNVYRIDLHLGNHPGARWVSFKDKDTGEVTKGIFLPDWETGGIRIRRGQVKMELFAIPVKGLVNTHVIIPAVWKGTDCGLGYKSIDFKKAVVGNMYVYGEVLSSDKQKIFQKYASRRSFRIGRYKKD